MATVALIPAKGRSNRIPGKNLRPLKGVPLFLWTVRAALGASKVDRVLVSTEDFRVAGLARLDGAEVLERPARLSEDGHEVGEVAVHAAENLPGDTTLVMLLPTSPLRTAAHIDEALGLHDGARPVVSVCPAPDLARKLHVRTGGGLFPIRLHGAAVLNGAIWIASAAHVVEHGGYSTDAAVPYIMEDVAGMDIDYEWQWALAEDA